MPIQLPDDPTELIYEDLVSAALTAYGNFVEMRLVLKRGGSEILEFDIVATPAAEDHAKPTLVEVKSGSFGAADLFKLYGQATFTGFETAWLVHRVEIAPERQDGIESIENGTCVQTKHVTVENLVSVDTYPLPLSTEVDPVLRHAIFLNTWWARLAGREAQAKFNSWRKNFGRALPGQVAAAKSYCSAVSESFFKRGPLLRAQALYGAYRSAPQLTKTLVSFHADQTGQSAEEIRKATWNTARHVWLQHTMMVEQSARIRLIKAALDVKAGLESSPETTIGVEDGALDWSKILETSLPDSFRGGMAKLQAHDTPHRVPYFFQMFVEVFGGFYFPNDPVDTGMIAEATGIPADRILDTLKLFDDFFPIPNGWVLEGSGDMVLLKGIPAYARGGGCFVRESAHKLASYRERFEASAWHMRSWHNAVYEILKPVVKES